MIIIDKLILDPKKKPFNFVFTNNFYVDCRNNLLKAPNTFKFCLQNVTFKSGKKTFLHYNLKLKIPSGSIFIPKKNINLRRRLNCPFNSCHLSLFLYSCLFSVENFCYSDLNSLGRYPSMNSDNEVSMFPSAYLNDIYPVSFTYRSSIDILLLLNHEFREKYTSLFHRFLIRFSYNINIYNDWCKFYLY